ncbi:MAG: chaperone NapD [Pseudomonadota bacterium]|nr:chaperone NapD [Pseudomonadota bacterium]
MTDEVHISSLVVHARPERIDAVAAALGALAGLEIHAIDPAGRLVAVLETFGAGPILDTIEAIRQMPGVLSVNLVYHHSESADSLAQEMPYENNPS